MLGKTGRREGKGRKTEWQGTMEKDPNVCGPPPPITQPKNQKNLLVAVIKFLSHFLAKTLNKSKTYSSKYWFALGILRINRLYVATTSSLLKGSFAVGR